MRAHTSPLNRKLFLPVVLLLLTALAACQSGTPDPGASATFNSPTAGWAPAGDADPSEAAGGDDAITPPAGGVDLTDPSAGLETFGSYRQQLTMSIEGDGAGAPYQSRQTILRFTAGEDESVTVQDSSGSSAPVYLFTARLGDFHYTQEAKDAACRSASLESSPWTDLNPALRLPPVFAMHQAGQREYAGMPAVRYTFDERSVPSQTGENGKAHGELWIARDGGAVLSYELSVEIQSPDFSGSRTWSYTLSAGGEEPVITLPEPCTPVLDDLPTLPGAENLTLQPGFQRYLSDAGREEAAEYYAQALPALGWTPLPGSEPGSPDLEADVTVLTYAREAGEGGRLLVIRIGESEGRLEVVAQSAVTRIPIQVDPGGEAPAAGEEEESGEPGAEPSPDAPGGSAGGLPDDLPVDPLAELVTRTDSFVMYETGSSAAQAADFYRSGLEDAGWTLDQEVEAYGTLTQTWSRQGRTLIVAIVQQGSTAQVMITAVAE